MGQTNKMQKHLHRTRAFWTQLYRLSRVAIMSCLLISMMGCGQMANGENQRNPASSPVVAKAIDPTVVAADTQFGLKLFGQLVKQTPGQNLFISPSSIAIALTMTYNGASGPTQQAMAKVLGLQGIEIDDVNQANASLRLLLTNPEPQVELTFANSLWTAQGLELQPKFLNRNRQFYEAQVTSLNFRDPRSPAKINAWVKQQTRNKISQVVDTLSPNDVLILVNAIYFKGVWTQAFDPLQTTIEPFYGTNGRFKNHPFMAQSGDYKYFETPDFQAVSLPYGKQGRFSLDIFLPNQKSNLAAFYKTLTAKNWQSWISQFRTRAGSVQIPRFKLEYTTQLKQALSALGMGIAFDPTQATFANLSSVPTHIGQVTHKTFIDVNEAGTEAAGTTAVGIRATSIPVDPPFKFMVDRPFFCVIRDRQTGTLLFMGSIVSPQSTLQ